MFLKQWNVAADDRPDALDTNSEVVVYNHVAEADKFTPWDAWIRSLQSVGNPFGRLCQAL